MPSQPSTSPCSAAIDLWQELEEATEAPRSVNFELLWSMLEKAIEQLPQAQQLAIAGNAIEQMAEIIRLRSTILISDWEAAHSEAELEAPTIEMALVDAWVRQSMAVDLDAFVEQPKSTRRRSVKVKLAPTDSVAGEVEPAAIVQMLDEMERKQSAADMVRELAGEENVAAWSSIIGQWLQNHALESSISFGELWQQLEMPWVKVWLGLLLGGFELQQSGSFYESEVWIATSCTSLSADGSNSHYEKSTGVGRDF
ncbi:hypothetical protein ACQ4M3_42050 [Leptolyngbya sp. AN03gr2]|uniref:hypothetical protein n=1 Tax=unclassified Leptolyngbya TaxID=2650499 RepID=UPI003D324015